MKDVFESFLPSLNLPLLVSFSNHLHDYGYSTKVEFDFWDMYGYNGHSDPDIAITTIKNHLNRLTVEKIADSNVPYKVVLVEGDRLNLKKLESQARFLAMMGVGVYLRNSGWMVLPGKSKINVSEDLVFTTLDKYDQDEAGVWGKFCTKCGVWYPNTEFYRNPNRNARDPRRNLCKECFNG